MRLISKIASYILVIITALTFLISTTGFTFYTHECTHHDSQSGIIALDECCSKIVEELSVESQSCCGTSMTSESASNCSSIDKNSNCCETDLNYYRLSEWFLESNDEQSTTVCYANEIEVAGSKLDGTNSKIPVIPKVNPVKKKPKQPLFRLYHQVKIDPPLI